MLRTCDKINCPVLRPSLPSLVSMMKDKLRKTEELLWHPLLPLESAAADDAYLNTGCFKKSIQHLERWLACMPLSLNIFVALATQ
jgi:hypothetical protein